MYQYESYLVKAENCVKKAREFSNDVRLVAFYTNAAKGFIQRASRLTLAEAMGLSLGLPVSGVKEIKEVIDEQSLLPILGR